MPGGLQRALAATNDRLTPDRSQFLLEFIRRTYHRPLTVKNRLRDLALQSLLNGLDTSSRLAPPAETVPLPLPPATWVDAVFAGRETPDALFPAILRSRGAALLYYGLLSLDDATRTWLVTQPRLVTELAGPHAAAFAVAAPGLRVRGSTLELPGGKAAAPAWEALVGHDANDAAAFTRALLANEEGRLASFFGTLAQLTSGELRVIFNLDAPEAAVRVAAARRVYAVFGRLTGDWRVDNAVFWRPALEPALLASTLQRGADGLPILPGTRQFWTKAFASQYREAPTSSGNGSSDASGGDPIDFAWLSEQIFTGHKPDDRRRYYVVLFASRLGPHIKRWSHADTIAAVRGAHEFPALVATLERARLADVASFAAAVRRAARITAIRDNDRAARTLAQFQGAIALVARAALRGSIRPQEFARVINGLAEIETSEQGDYEGRLVRWLTGWLAAHLRAVPPTRELDAPSAGPVERDMLAALAGAADIEPRFVDWEGTRYRLDFARAEGMRLARLLGEYCRPYLSSARTLVAASDALAQGTQTPEQVRQHAAAFNELATALGWAGEDGWAGTDVPRRSREARAMFQRAVQAGDGRRVGSLVAALRGLADDLLARGLLELAYAVALGHPDRPAISADEAASRHDFGLHGPGSGRLAAWQLASAGAMPGRGWRVTGSLLGLDVRLADFALLRLSSRPPRKPSLDDDHRRVFIETVALVDAASLTDADGDTIVSAMRKGRERLVAARTAAAAFTIADDIRLSPARRTLLSWVVEKDRERLPAFLSPSELLWLGIGNVPVGAGVHAWGVPATGRTGCVCLEVIDRVPLEILAGRWHSGVFASGFPDLNLRLAELLDELQMPASLLAAVLASATPDLVDSAAARDSDDRRALMEAVQALRVDRVEQYLATLTADGPLVPVDSGGAR